MHAMKTTTPAALVLGLAVVAALLTGCVTTPGTGTLVPVPKPTVSSVPVATDAPTETPVVREPPAEDADAAVKAEFYSGLTAEDYASVTGKVAEVVTISGDRQLMIDALEAIGAEYGKPVVVIAHYRCGTSDVLSWGVTGALFANKFTECGTGFSASQDLILSEVGLRAEEKGWKPEDYITIFAELVG